MFVLKSLICQFCHLYQLPTSYPFSKFVADIRSTPVNSFYQELRGNFLCRGSLCSQWSLPILPARGRHPLAPEAKKTRRLVCLVMSLQEIIHSREDQTSAHVWTLGLLLGQKEIIWYPVEVSVSLCLSQPWHHDRKGYGLVAE